MGPYYRNTSQGMGGFFEMFYEHPIVMAIVVAVVVCIGVYIWRKKKSDEVSRL